MSDPDYEARKQVAHANLEFYRTVERNDFEAMLALWLESDEIRCVHPGSELLTGPDEVHASWRAIFEAQGTIRIDITDVSISLQEALAWVACTERIHVPGETRELESVAAATNLFRRTPEGWKLLLHHSSPISRRFFRDPS